jgi:hypothetical protein
MMESTSASPHATEMPEKRGIPCGGGMGYWHFILGEYNEHRYFQMAS